MIKYFSPLLLFCFINQPAADCQVRFSQFYASPLLINPANTGRFNKSYRVGGAYRREINAQEKIYTLGTFSLESKIFSKATPGNDCFAAAISGLAEKSETEGIKNTYLSLSLAYQKGLDEEGTQQLGIGFQTTFSRRQLLKPNYVFEDQLLSWANSGYSNIDIFNLGNVDISYTDLNAGLIYQGKINADNFFTAGVSMYHITSPRRTFQGGELKVPRQIWNHLAWQKNLPGDRQIYSALLISYSNNSISDLLAGLTYQMNINRDNHFNLGAWLRKHSNGGISVIPAVGLNFYGFALTATYDINISLKNRSQKGASEISLGYTHARTRERFLENKFIKF